MTLEQLKIQFEIERSGLNQGMIAGITGIKNRLAEEPSDVQDPILEILSQNLQRLKVVTPEQVVSSHENPDCPDKVYSERYLYPTAKMIVLWETKGSDAALLWKLKWNPDDN